MQKFKSSIFHSSIILVLLLFCSSVFAAHLHLEKEYQEAWCADHKGITEYVLDDKTRVGIVLILEKDGDERYLKRLQILSEKYQIRVWIMKPEDLKK